MFLKSTAVTVGTTLLGCALFSITANAATTTQVTALLEANTESGLAQEMHPKVFDRLAKMYKAGAVQATDINRYGSYLEGFQDLKTVFYDVVEWTGVSESAVQIGEYFILTGGNDPLQKYGRHLHALEQHQRSTIDEIVWNENTTGVHRRRALETHLLDLRLFDNERDMQSFIDGVFVAYIHSHLWAEEKRVRFGSSRFTSHDYFLGHIRLRNMFSFSAHQKTEMLRGFRELEDNGFIEILDARSPEAQNGIAHTRERMPLRPGEIVVIPVLTLLSKIRHGLKEEGDLQFLKILYPFFREGVKTQNWTNYHMKMQERGHGNLLEGSNRVAYIRFLPPWPVPVSSGSNR